MKNRDKPGQASQVATVGVDKAKFIGAVFLLIVWTTMVALAASTYPYQPQPPCEIKHFLTIEDHNRVIVCVVERKPSDE